MFNTILEWLAGNKTELLGAILGILYIRFSIKQNILTWPTGLLTSVLYVLVFYTSGLYAAMSLQVYYVVISFYGWYFWLKGNNHNVKTHFSVRVTTGKMWIKLTIATIIIYSAIFLVLTKYSDSDVPFLDSLTTTLSITATWMLAKKYIENWLIWIFVDFVSTGLYFYKNLWPTVILFLVYTVMAIIGYFEWKKNLISEN
jgi:nicotinamide mononucleotide transporter